MKGSGARHRGLPLWTQFLLSLLFIMFLLGGLYASYLFYSTVRDVIAYTQLPSLPNLRLPEPGKKRAGEKIILAEVPIWEGKERINILLLGLDRRPDEQYSRTDTMILSTIDPVSLSAAMLSIPRDLWVTIPGYGESRINTAHYTGEKEKYPGGGPALAKKTVQYNFGIPVHYYVRVDFEGFKKIVDTLGGIDINVKNTIQDDEYPDDNYGYDPLYIPAGLQHMDGELALKYSRTRHGRGDFDRAYRQQEVLLAIRDKALQLNLLPKAPELMVALADTVQTDLQPSDILNLVQMADKIKEVKTVVIDESLGTPHITPTGAWVLIPNREKIRPMIDELFAKPSPAAQVTVVPVVIPAEIVEEAAKIAVQNGTKNVGLGPQAVTFLKNRGFQIESFGEADRLDYPQTILIDYTGKKHTIQHLVEMFAISPENVRRSPNLKSEIDIRLILGEDFRLPLTE